MFLKSKKIFTLLALSSGATLPLAFAPFGHYLIAEISLILLLFTWFNSTPRLAFWRGWLFGAAFFGAGIHWVYISIHHYGNAPVVLALVILSLLVSFLALYFALQGCLLQKFFPKNSWYKYLLIFPFSLVFFEWVRGWFLSGFPWLFLGYGHIDSPLCGFAGIFGVYGVSFFIAQTAGAIFYAFCERKNKKLITALALFIILIWGSGALLSRINWTKQTGKILQISLIQGNIPQERKWKPQELPSILNTYALLTVKSFKSKIIIWPEAAIPAYPENVSLYLKAISFAAKKRVAQ